MTSPGGFSVGRVSVTVLPDTSQFGPKLRAYLEALEQRLKLTIPVTFDKNQLKQSLSQIGDESRGMFKGDLFDMPNIVPQFRQAFQQVGKVGKKTFSGIAKTATKTFTGITGFLFSMVGSLAKIATLGGVVLGVFAVIQTAVGGIAAGIAGLPVVISTLAGPIAAIALGFEGIKKAAKTLSPEFEKLKQTLSDTFVRVLTPVFERLRVVFPALQTGLTKVAEATGFFASNLVKVITSEAGLAAIRRMFTGISTALRIIAPAVSRFVLESLKIAGTSQLYQILGDTIRGVLNVFSDFLAEVRKTELLTATLTAVKNILITGVNLFAEWAKAGMQFLTSAAPGITSFIQSLGNFFGRFDWAKLGALFSSVLQSLADGLNNVPGYVISDLMTSIQGLATSFKEFVASGGLNKLIQLFSTLVWILQKVIDFFTWVSEGLNTLKVTMREANLDAFFPFLTKEIKGTALAAGEAKKKYGALGESSKNLGAATGALGSKFHATAVQTVAALNRMRAQGAVSLTELATIMGVQGESGRAQFIAAFRRIAPGMINSKGEVVGAANAVAGAAAAALDNVNGYGSGAALAQGFANGIWNNISSAVSAAASMVAQVAAKLPNSPAKEGPFSGHGWTPYRGEALVKGFAQGISGASYLAANATEDMIRGVDAEMNKYARSGGLSADLKSAITGDDFGGIGEQVERALSTWTIEMDPQGVARLANKGNTRLARR